MSSVSGRAVAAGVVDVAAAGVLAVTVAAALLGRWWPLSLLEHFRIQYLGCGLGLGAVAAATRRWRSVDLCAFAVLANLVLVAPGLAAAPLPAPRDAVPLRLLVLNVHTESTAHDRVRALIDDLDPDVVALVEVDERWLAALAPSLDRYPARIEAPRADNFGVALYSRAPLDGGVESLGSDLPTIVARTGGVEVVVAHPMPPVSHGGAELQARMLDALAARVRGRAPLVLAGDLNATPWSRPFAQLLARTGLRDTRAGFGVQATFPAGSWLLRIPLDHVLVSPGIGVRERRVERDVGSDHLPVYVVLAVPPPRG